MIQGPAVDGLVNLRELEARAEAILDPVAFAYYVSGAGDEDTLRDNEAAFGRRRLRPRVLVDVDVVDTSTTILGVPVALPVGVAPTAQHGLATPEGEAATHRGAAAAGTLFCLSTLASRPLEDVAAASDGPRWFQLYTHADRGITEDLVARAVGAGYTAIVVTADLPVIGRRDRERRAATRGPTACTATSPLRRRSPAPIRRSSRSAMTWTDLADLAGRVGLPVIVKGVLTAEDAELAVEHGAAAVWVSNHGGRQLDRVPASIDVLAEVVAAVDGRAEVYLDGGVRRGTDVLTALALGARAVFVGRPVIYGLALGGAEGVTARARRAAPRDRDRHGAARHADARRRRPRPPCAEARAPAGTGGGAAGPGRLSPAGRSSGRRPRSVVAALVERRLRVGEEALGPDLVGVLGVAPGRRSSSRAGRVAPGSLRCRALPVMEPCYPALPPPTRRPAWRTEAWVPGSRSGGGPPRPPRGWLSAAATGDPVGRAARARPGAPRPPSRHRTGRRRRPGPGRTGSGG